MKLNMVPEQPVLKVSPQSPSPMTVSHFVRSGSALITHSQPALKDRSSRIGSTCMSD